MSMSATHDRNHEGAARDDAAKQQQRGPGGGSEIERRLLQRKIARRAAARGLGGDGVAAGAPAAVAAAGRGGGAPLPANLQKKFESSTGADLSGVRVHTGEASQAAAESVGAKAYATGNDIHFAAGQYDPSSKAGEELVAHEVAHTVQQGGGAASGVQHKLEVSSPGDAHEVEADAAAAAMVAGKAASVSGAPTAIARAPSATVGDKGDIEVTVPIAGAKSKVEVAYAEIEGEIGGDLKFKSVKGGAPTEKKPAEGKKEEGAKGVEVAGETKFGPKGVESVKVEATKELGKTGDWGWEGSADFKITEKGPDFTVGVSAKNSPFAWGPMTFGPTQVGADLFTFDHDGPKVLKVSVDSAITVATEGTFMGYNVTPTLKGKLELTPDWPKLLAKLGEMAAEVIASDAAAAGAAIAIPLAVFAAGLVAWAKAGHEYDELEGQVSGLKSQAKKAVRAALGEDLTQDYAGTMLQTMAPALVKNVTQLGLDARRTLATKLKIPEASIPAAAKKNATISDYLYVNAFSVLWNQAYPELVAACNTPQDRAVLNARFEYFANPMKW